MNLKRVKISWRDPLVKIILACLIIVFLLVISLAVKIAVNGNNPVTALSALVTVPLAILVGPILSKAKSSL